MSLLGGGDVFELTGAVDPVAGGARADAELVGELLGDAAAVALREKVEVEESDVAVMAVGVGASILAASAACSRQAFCELLPRLFRTPCAVSVYPVLLRDVKLL